MCPYFCLSFLSLILFPPPYFFLSFPFLFFSYNYLICKFIFLLTFIKVYLFVALFFLDFIMAESLSHLWSFDRNSAPRPLYECVSVSVMCVCGSIYWYRVLHPLLGTDNIIGDGTISTYDGVDGYIVLWMTTYYNFALSYKVNLGMFPDSSRYTLDHPWDHCHLWVYHLIIHLKKINEVNRATQGKRNRREDPWEMYRR